MNSVVVERHILVAPIGVAKLLCLIANMNIAPAISTLVLLIEVGG